jgi:thiol:disulfide interchange protein DsbD
MPELAAGQISLATVWLLGVSMGMTACTVTCLPFVGTWVLGRAAGKQEAYLHTAAFLAGRVTTYTLLGALAGALGTGLAQALGGNLGNTAIGLASLLAAGWLLRPTRAATVPPGTAVTMPLRPMRRSSPRDGLPPVFLGAALSLTPCTPLASLLALAANAGGAPAGASYGLAFGLGAAVTPVLILAPLAGRLGRELRAHRTWLGRWLTWGAALVLLLLGLRRLALAVPV